MKARKELTREVAARYRGANRKEKGIILNEFASSTGYNRFYAALILRQYGKTVSKGKIRYAASKKHRKRGKGGPPRYGREAGEAVIRLWKLFNCPCSKRLVRVLRNPAALSGSGYSDQTKTELIQMSAATIDRALKPERRKILALKGNSCAKGTMALKDRIPIRTFGDWRGVAPGQFQIDRVDHDG